jgi:hypothetical protein
MTVAQSGMRQPNHPFTFAEYKEFIQEYWKLHKITPYPVEQIAASSCTYRERLPIYLLARCPICGGGVWEPIDTFSLNGPGWIPHRSGHGWHGLLSLPPGQVFVPPHTKPKSRPSYDAECDHVRIVDWCVNLNGRTPDDVVLIPYVHIRSEIPYILLTPMKARGAYMVIHSLAIGRFDDIEPQPHYTAYFMTYFSEDQQTFDEAMHDIYRDGEGSLACGSGDFVLAKWVESGRLLWIDPNDPQLALRRGSVADFPYANIQGRRGYAEIVKGKLNEGDLINRVLYFLFPPSDVMGICG